MVVLYYFEEPPDCFPWWLPQFTFPPVAWKGSLFSTPSSTFIICSFFFWVMVILTTDFYYYSRSVTVVLGGSQSRPEAPWRWCLEVSGVWKMLHFSPNKWNKNSDGHRYHLFIHQMGKVQRTRECTRLAMTVVDRVKSVPFLWRTRWHYPWKLCTWPLTLKVHIQNFLLQKYYCTRPTAKGLDHQCNVGCSAQRPN